MIISNKKYNNGNGNIIKYHNNYNRAEIWYRKDIVFK